MRSDRSDERTAGAGVQFSSSRDCSFTSHTSPFTAACTRARLRSLQAEYYVDRGFVTKYLQTEI